MTYTTQPIDLVVKYELNAGDDKLTGMLQVAYITTSHAVPLLAWIMG